MFQSTHRKRWNLRREIADLHQNVINFGFFVVLRFESRKDLKTVELEGIKRKVTFSCGS